MNPPGLPPPDEVGLAAASCLDMEVSTFEEQCTLACGRDKMDMLPGASFMYKKSSCLIESGSQELGCMRNSPANHSLTELEEGESLCCAESASDCHPLNVPVIVGSTFALTSALVLCIASLICRHKRGRPGARGQVQLQELPPKMSGKV